tara:strand:+ start:217 stop:459 length:243 start_codon:yes stop_codon:yes gene_type:complete
MVPKKKNHSSKRRRKKRKKKKKSPELRKRCAAAASATVKRRKLSIYHAADVSQLSVVLSQLVFSTSLLHWPFSLKYSIAF